MSEPPPHLIACPDCDALYRRRPLRPGERARCSRCGAVLYRASRLSIDQMLALVLTALVKLSHLARVLPGIALWIFAALTVLLAVILSFDLRSLWSAREVGGAAEEASSRVVTRCHACDLVFGDALPHSRCPRCGAPLHHRKVDSLARTWALLTAAAILYVPANLLPMMEISSLFGRESNTIMSGIVYFWTSGSPDLATLIFFVSIFVSLAKLGSLAARRGRRRSLKQSAQLFRVVEFVGR